MNNKINFKNLLVQATFVAAVLIGTSSCTDNPSHAATKDSAEESNKAKFNANNEKDAQFLVSVAEINMMESQLGQLAQQNARMKDVKELGKMMEEAHSKSMRELTVLANTKSMVIPTSQTDNTTDAYQKLKSLNSREFDKAYCDMMVNGHKDAIVLFEKAEKESVDQDIKQWATASLPELHTHLDHAIACQKMLAIN